MNLKRHIRKLFKKLGIDIRKYSSALDFNYAHAKLIKDQNINLVLDCGANIGQFVEQLRENYSYKGDVVSFEPLDDAFQLLNAKTKNDAHWIAYNYALGDLAGKCNINVSKNSQSSSLLGMQMTHVIAAPESMYTDRQVAEIKTLDGIYASIGACDKNVMLKADVQGYEMKLLKGAEESLSHIKAVRLEMSVISLYESEVLIEDILSYMRSKGFRLHAIEPNFCDPETGAILQVDGLFSRIS
jgi:FkbM family methyltransferase